MQEIIHAFGIDWRLIIIQIVNFGILVAILWYFLYTPLLNILKSREEKIKKGISDAEKAEHTQKETESEKHKVLQNAHREAGDIVTRAVSLAEEKEKKLIDDALEKIEREKTQNIADAKGLFERTMKESEAEITKRAFLVAETILNEKLSK